MVWSYFQFKYTYDIKRGIKLEKIKALTRTTQAGNFQFVIHPTDEYDYRYESKEDIDGIFEAIQFCYQRLTDQQLPIYIVDADVKQFVTTKKDLKSGK